MLLDMKKFQEYFKIVGDLLTDILQDLLFK